MPERIHVAREAGDRSIGDTLVPYRWEAGDYFGYFSFLSQQQSMKGLQVEMQPSLGGRPDSIVWFLGTNESRWQEVFQTSAFADDLSTGASYLREARFGTIAVDGVFSHRDAGLGTAKQDQFVASAALDTEFAFAGQSFGLEVQESIFAGDHVGAQGKAGNGFLVELTGRPDERPVDYRVRSEIYTGDFQPRNAVVNANRASIEGHVGWLLGTGQRLRGRFQHYSDGYDGGDRLDTLITGVNASGPLLAPWIDGLAGNADLYLQRRSNESDAIDQVLLHFSTDAGRDLGCGWFGRGSFLVQHLFDQAASDADLSTVQLQASADRRFRLGPFDATVTPGFLLRFLRNGNDSNEIHPTIAATLSRRAHAFSLDYGALVQDRSMNPRTTATQNLRAEYRVSFGPNAVGAEFRLLDVTRRGSADTRGWDVGLFWTLFFDRPAVAVPGSLPVAPAAEPGRIRAVDVAEIAPGLPIDDVAIQLAGFGPHGSDGPG